MMLGSLTVFLIVSSCHGRALLQMSQGHTAARPFMLASGMSSAEELCLAVEGGVDVDGAAVVSEPCSSVIAAGDGREVFTFDAGGKLAVAAGGKCVGVLDERVVMTDCAAAPKSELLGNGQLRLGDACVTQVGLAPGKENVAATAAVQASSTSDVAAHGAGMAVDGNDASFWASKPGAAGPITFTVDFGVSKKIESGEINWEFPAKAFAIALSTDGAHWTEAFSTDVNALSDVRVDLGSTVARYAKIVMSEAHPLYGKYHGNNIYGISALAFFSAGLSTVVEDCAKAGAHGDARDKVFTSSVAEYDTSAAKALRAELPSLAAAKASLAATIGELASALPSMRSCKGGAALVGKTRSLLKEAVRFRSSADAVDVQSGVDESSIDELLRVARATITEARKELM